MKVRVVGCSGGSVKGRFLSCFLVNEEIALDAGGLTGPLTLEEQLRVRHVIVTHTHLDHNCGLPFLVENAFGRLDEPITVYGIPAVVQSLQAHMFNDVMWPDFTKLPGPHRPTMRFEPIEVEETFRIDGLSFTPIEVEHLIPTVGVLVEDEEGAILYTSDTGPTHRVWEVASSHPRLKCVITEVSFSNDDDELAKLSGHMTPSILASELAKLHRDVPVLITHTKPSHVPRIERELRALGLSNVELIEQGKTYQF
ncbi:MAG TPA: 3',5'-cyclic-nucleotide phosphodiesterase [Vicinamibacteria bacterium]|nr:3',5'-cyclic-nucleotide phosphodiesterase [Vicinamibacteria bacterium]